MFFQKHEASTQQLTHRELNLRVNMSQRDLAYCSVCQQTVKKPTTQIWLFVTSGEICHCPSVKTVTSNKLWLPDKASVCKHAPIVEGQSTMAWVPGLLLPEARLDPECFCRSSWQTRQVNSLAWCPLALPVDSGSTSTLFVRDHRNLLQQVFLLLWTRMYAGI